MRRRRPDALLRQLVRGDTGRSPGQGFVVRLPGEFAQIGHNGGPPLEPDEDLGAVSWRGWCWRRAHKKAWKTPPREIALRRLARAEELGMSYRDYTLEILERGVYL
ncbi:MAG TPA: hypothetical protein VIZ17_04905 [Acetobacteraceae bacterium]